MNIITKIWKAKTPYVTEDGKKALRNYKYAGADYSLCYIYGWSPLAELVVKYMPSYVA